MLWYTPDEADVICKWLERKHKNLKLMNNLSVHISRTKTTARNRLWTVNVRRHWLTLTLQSIYKTENINSVWLASSQLTFIVITELFRLIYATFFCVFFSPYFFLCPFLFQPIIRQHLFSLLFFLSANLELYLYFSVNIKIFNNPI